jgi:hypothetical protein
MAKSNTQSPTGLLSESAKKASRGTAGAARKAVGMKAGSKKSPTGLMSEAAKKTGLAVKRAMTGTNSSTSRNGKKR